MKQPPGYVELTDDFHAVPQKVIKLIALVVTSVLWVTIIGMIIMTAYQILESFTEKSYTSVCKMYGYNDYKTVSLNSETNTLSIECTNHEQENH